MKKIVLITLVLMTLTFGLASCSDGSGAGVGDGSDKSLFVGKWKGPTIGVEGTYSEYKTNGTYWFHGLTGDFQVGTWYLSTYEGRSVFVECTDPPYSGLPYAITWFYDYEFKNDGNELHLHWLGNAGGNVSIPDIKYEVRTKVK